MDCVKVDLELEEVLSSESVPTTYNIPSSLQQQDLLGRPLLQDLPQVPLESEIQLC